MVEVFQAGAWHIYDPTFNVTYESAGRRLSAEEVQRTFRDGTYASVQPVFLGGVRYPARVSTYYMSWLPLFDNVYVEDGRQSGRLLGLPPLRYWFGPRFYYSGTTGLSTAHIAVLGRLYFLFVGLLPSLVIVLGLGACLLLALEMRARRAAIERPGTVTDVAPAAAEAR